MNNKELAEKLELIIDAEGLGKVLTAIENVCDAKAEHVQTKWQDKITTEWWLNASYWIGEARDKIYDKEIRK